MRAKQYNEKLLRAMLKRLQQWSKLVSEHKDDGKIDGRDLVMTVAKKQHSYIPFVGDKLSLIILSGYYQDPKGGVANNNELHNIYKEIQSFNDNLLLRGLQLFLNAFLGFFQGKKPLSFLAHKSVFRWPLMTFSGRQFNAPYKKRCNVTLSALTDQFIDELAKITSHINFKQPHLDLIIQMAVGGGACRSKGLQKIDGLTVTTVPVRNNVFGFTFDLFYLSQDALPNAEKIQAQMGQIISKCYNTNGKQKRYFWATFGPEEQLDMTNPHTVSMYYDSTSQYQQLQKAKEIFDPKDLFHTSLTVKLPNGN